MTVSVFDAAQFILKTEGAMTAMKLQKLCFYSQSWHAAITGKPLFEGEFQAWANGPVCYDLFVAHKGQFMVTEGFTPEGDADALVGESKSIVLDVLANYATLSPQELSDLTHSEIPWLQTRNGLPADALSSSVIPLDLMVEHCRKLLVQA